MTTPLRRALEALEQARPAFENLRNNQTQLDFDGCNVGVSRQALDESLMAIDQTLGICTEELSKPDSVADREAIARVIEPVAWIGADSGDRFYTWQRQESLKKADAILALLPAARAGEDVVERAARSMCSYEHNNLRQWDRESEEIRDYWRCHARRALNEASFLRAPEAAPGWQLVPQELTTPMLTAAYEKMGQRIKSGDLKLEAIPGSLPFALWEAMLSAAPSAPSVEKPSEEIIREQRDEWPDRQEGWPVVRPVADARNEGIEEAAVELERIASLGYIGNIIKNIYREAASIVRALKSPPAEGGK